MELFSGFDAASAVKRPTELYGWNKESGLLDKLQGYASIGISFLLYGERRSGKTSLLYCLRYRILTEMPTFLPVFIDFQGRPDITTSEKSYDFIFREIARSLVRSNIFGKEWLKRNWADGYQFYSVDPYGKGQCVSLAQFEDYMNVLSWSLQNDSRSLYLMFDEYERLPTYFANMSDRFFYPFRSLQENYDRRCGGICYMLAGAETVSTLDHSTGSPQFNLTSTQIPVAPLQKQDFIKLWEDSRAACSEASRELLDRHTTDMNEIYEMCGGRPSFAKVLGNAWALGSTDEDVQILSSWYKNIYERQPEEARNVLDAVALNQRIVKPAMENRLRDLFLIEEDTRLGGWKLKGTLWAKYVVQRNVLPEDVSFSNAGELAEMIISKGQLTRLLEMRRGKGEKSDWLEFKAALIPDDEQKKRDAKSKNRDFSDDEYLWHTVKPILAMRNTRGGLVLIGVADDGEVIGLPQEPGLENEGDYVRNNFLNRIGKNKFNLTNAVISLENAQWDPVNGRWLKCGLEKIGDRTVLAILIHPMPEYFNEECYIQHHLDNLKNIGPVLYHLVRNDYQSIDFLNALNFAQEKPKYVNRDMEDLRQFWQDLLGFQSENEA